MYYGFWLYPYSERRIPESIRCLPIVARRIAFELVESLLEISLNFCRCVPHSLPVSVFEHLSRFFLLYIKLPGFFSKEPMSCQEPRYDKDPGHPCHGHFWIWTSPWLAFSPALLRVPRQETVLNLKLSMQLLRLASSTCDCRDAFKEQALK